MLSFCQLVLIADPTMKHKNCYYYVFAMKNKFLEYIKNITRIQNVFYLTPLLLRVGQVVWVMYNRFILIIRIYYVYAYAYLLQFYTIFMQITQALVSKKQKH